MKIVAKRNWMDIKTQRSFAAGGTYEVTERYGEKMVSIGHALEAKAQSEVEDPEPKKKAPKKKAPKKK